MSKSERLAEVDEINFAPRVQTPLLMINGRYDMDFPVKECQMPLFRLLGTPEADKRHLLFDKGHGPALFSNEEIRAVLDWLDRYLGVVEK